jgi:hypothetical protein
VNEVKSLDIAEGSFRHDEMMREGKNATVELGRQRSDGRQASIAESVIDPYRKLGDARYDPRSLIRVIDTLREKFRRAFLASQIV